MVETCPNHLGSLGPAPLKLLESFSLNLHHLRYLYKIFKHLNTPRICKMWCGDVMHALRTLPPRLPHLLLSCTTSGQSKLQAVVIFITSEISVSSPFPEGCHIWSCILGKSFLTILNFLTLDDLDVLILCFHFSLHPISASLKCARLPALMLGRWQ